MYIYIYVYIYIYMYEYIYIYTTYIYIYIYLHKATSRAFSTLDSGRHRRDGKVMRSTATEPQRQVAVDPGGTRNTKKKTGNPKL